MSKPGNKRLVRLRRIAALRKLMQTHDLLEPTQSPAPDTTKDERI
jgi:hypothetical protein